MFLVGLTGGIASGKSTVAEVWGQLGAEIIDADQLAREVVAPGTHGLNQIIEEFGNEVLLPDGSLNREKLAELVFTNPTKRMKLESITHPLISALARDRISSSKAGIVVYVIPLLAESNSQLPFDYVVTVEAREVDQIERMVASRNMTQAQAKARISSQASPAMRANLADRILNSNQSLALLIKDARDLWLEIEKCALTSKERHLDD